MNKLKSIYSIIGGILVWLFVINNIIIDPIKDIGLLTFIMNILIFAGIIIIIIKFAKFIDNNLNERDKGMGLAIVIMLIALFAALYGVNNKHSIDYECRQSGPFATDC